MALPGLSFTADVDVFVGQITEVDMASAGMTVIRLEGLVPPDVLARLEAIPKSEQSVAVGHLSKLPNFSGLSGRVTEGIRRRVEAMLEANGIGAERILSVKRDAVFVTGPPPGHLVLKDGTRFRAKHSYTSYARLGKVECYAIPRRGMADLKGIPSERRSLHENYTTRFVLDILGMMERGDVRAAAETIQLFRREYAARLLPLGFYREFNSESAFAVRGGSKLFLVNGLDVDRAEVELSFNLKNVIIPLARALA